jgi:hypothetical protein
MSLHALATNMASKGRNGDSMLVHMTPGEVHGLQALAMKHGGSLTVNPDTGLPEANFLKSLLPMLAGFALGPAGFGLVSSAMGAGAIVGGITGIATGSLSKGLMAGLGAYGGFGIGESLAGMGANAMGDAAASSAYGANAGMTDVAAQELGFASAEEAAQNAAAQAAIKTQVDAADRALYGAKGVAAGMSIKNLDPERYNKIVQNATVSTDGLKQKNLELYEASRTFQAGWSEAFAKYAEDAGNAATQAQQLFSSVTKGIEDAFVQFAQTGKLGFKNLLSDITQQLLRSQIKQLLTNLFTPGKGNEGGVLGALFTGAKNLLGFAGGGIIPTNAPVIVGERGPEVISGAAGRVVTSNNQLGGSNVTYNINAVDAMSFKQMLAQDPTFLHAVAEQGRRTLPGAR